MEDKVVAGEVVEVLVSYHVASHNSDRLSHPDSTTGARPIYPSMASDLHTMSLKYFTPKHRSLRKRLERDCRDAIWQFDFSCSFAIKSESGHLSYLSNT